MASECQECEIEEGDLVQLLSGGPTMSARSIASSAIYCMWLNVRGALHEAVFDRRLLRRVDRTNSSGPGSGPIRVQMR
jgi:uncharacterized protein YodC (DUF2158 family)